MVRPSMRSLSLSLCGTEFVRAGVVVVGPKPPGTLTLEDGPEERNQLRAIVDALWSEGEKVVKGRNIWGPGDLLNAIRAAGLSEDVVLTNLRNAETEVPVLGDADATRGVNPTLDGPDRKGWGVEYLHRADGARHIYLFRIRSLFPWHSKRAFG